jgi:hypothetical protein
MHQLEITVSAGSNRRFKNLLQSQKFNSICYSAYDTYDIVKYQLRHKDAGMLYTFIHECGWNMLPILFINKQAPALQRQGH